MGKQQKQPKSLRSIRNIRNKEPKLIEGIKKTMIIKGNKTSEPIREFMKEIRAFRRDRSVFYSRKHEVHPFEEKKQIQKYCEKSDCSLFLFGSHSKKRPDNIVIGRTFDNKVLDMVEFGVYNLKSFSELNNTTDIPFQIHPYLVFQGDLWETDQTFQKTRNLLNDFFFENNKIKGIQIDNIMQTVMCFSVLQDKRIYMRVYEAKIQGKDILEDDGKILIEELGPHAELVIRRTQFADTQIWKQATYVPKPKKRKAHKNIKHDSLGNKKGKLYVDRQDFKQIETKRRKGISKTNGKVKPKVENLQAREQNQFGVNL